MYAGLQWPVSGNGDRNRRHYIKQICCDEKGTTCWIPVSCNCHIACCHDELFYDNIRAITEYCIFVSNRTCPGTLNTIRLALTSICFSLLVTITLYQSPVRSLGHSVRISLRATFRLFPTETWTSSEAGKRVLRTASCKPGFLTGMLDSLRYEIERLASPCCKFLVPSRNQRQATNQWFQKSFPPLFQAWRASNPWAWYRCHREVAAKFVWSVRVQITFDRVKKIKGYITKISKDILCSNKLITFPGTSTSKVCQECRCFGWQTGFLMPCILSNVPETRVGFT